MHPLDLTAVPATLDLGAGIMAESWAFGGQVPVKELRISAGDTVTAELSNQLPDGTTTSVHWHGIALRGDMEDPQEPLSYDDEWVVVLDDWLDGVTGIPEEVFTEVSHCMGGMDKDETTASPPRSPGDDMPTGFMLMGTTSELLGGEAGDVKYPYHLVDGRVPADPAVHTCKPGLRVRLRIINAGSDTAYRVALGGHRLTITHTDGFPVEHQQVDALLIGMGERYDVLVTLGDGVFPLVALAEGKDATGMPSCARGGAARRSRRCDRANWTA